jgi:hypothetical protein
MTFSGYQVLTRAGWRPGDGTPRHGEFLRRAPNASAE